MFFYVIVRNEEQTYMQFFLRQHGYFTFDHQLQTNSSYARLIFIYA